jgi:hypothetical protein
VDTVYRPLGEQLPDAPEALYKWTDIVWLVATLFFVFWIAYRQEPTSYLIAGMILSFSVPQFLCGKFCREQKPQKSIGSVIGTNKSLIVFCWIVAFGVIALAILGGLGVPPFNEILSVLPIPITFVFQRIPIWLIPLILVVFLPVFMVATFIEKRVWLRWVWASAVSVVALVLLYL